MSMRTKYPLVLSFALAVLHISPVLLAAQATTESKAPLSPTDKSAIVKALL